MRADTRVELVRDALARYRAGRISRRQVIGLLGALGVSAAAAPLLLGDAKAKNAPGGGGGHAGHAAVLLQEGTPEGEGPPPAATPVLGERPDGTYVWRVAAGGFSEADQIEAQAFFPEEITINAGDAVFFEMRGFHTVTFLSGQEVPKLLVTEEAAGTPMAGGTPAAGGARTVVNPAAAFPAGGPSYDGTGYVNSGVPLDPTAPPFTLTFTAPGTYEYLCLVHPKVMKGTVTVQEQGAERPQDQAAYDQMAAEQEADLFERGRALIARAGAASPAAGAGGTVHEVSAGAGEGQVQVLRFLPDRLEIKAGDTVRWTNPTETEPHTVTFLGGEPAPEFFQVEPAEGGPPTLVLNPVLAGPAGGPVFAGTGLANSGVLGRELPEFPDEFPRSATFELTFDTEGEHGYYCAFHAGGPDDPPTEAMTGRIVVSPAG